MRILPPSACSAGTTCNRQRGQRRPPNNRSTPEADELAACFPILRRQIELIQPRLIVALGRPAVHRPCSNQEVGDLSSRLVVKTCHYGDIPAVVTHHPAPTLLRNFSPDKA